MSTDIECARQPVCRHAWRRGIYTGAAKGGPSSAVLVARADRRILAAGLAGAFLLAGCTSMPPERGFDQVQAMTAERTRKQITWRQGGPEDRAVDKKVNTLLEKPLTKDAAVQITLLNNHRLQATYEDLGLAQAHLVQAGLFSNPIFSAEVAFVEGGGQPELGFGIAQNFLSKRAWDIDLRYVDPERRRRCHSSKHSNNTAGPGAALAGWRTDRQSGLPTEAVP